MRYSALLKWVYWDFYVNQVESTKRVGSVSLHPFFYNYSLCSPYFAGGTLMISLRLKGAVGFFNKHLNNVFDWFIIVLMLDERFYMKIYIL